MFKIKTVLLHVVIVSYILSYNMHLNNRPEFYNQIESYFTHSSYHDDPLIVIPYENCSIKSGKFINTGLLHNNAFISIFFDQDSKLRIAGVDAYWPVKNKKTEASISKKEYSPVIIENDAEILPNSVYTLVSFGDNKKGKDVQLLLLTGDNELSTYNITYTKRQHSFEADTFSIEFLRKVNLPLGNTGKYLKFSEQVNRFDSREMAKVYLYGMIGGIYELTVNSQNIFTKDIPVPLPHEVTFVNSRYIGTKKGQVADIKTMHPLTLPFGEPISYLHMDLKVISTENGNIYVKKDNRSYKKVSSYYRGYYTYNSVDGLMVNVLDHSFTPKNVFVENTPTVMKSFSKKELDTLIDNGTFGVYYGFPLESLEVKLVDNELNYVKPEITIISVGGKKNLDLSDFDAALSEAAFDGQLRILGDKHLFDITSSTVSLTPKLQIANENPIENELYWEDTDSTRTYSISWTERDTLLVKWGKSTIRFYNEKSMNAHYQKSLSTAVPTMRAHNNMLHFSGLNRYSELSIYSVQGKKVYSQNISTINALTLNNFLSKGIYFVSIRNSRMKKLFPVTIK